MNTKVTYALIIAFFVAFGWAVLRIPAGYKQRENEQLGIHQSKIDSLERVWADSLHRRELKALAVFQEYIRKLDRAEGEIKYWKGRYTHEINSNRHFNDSDLDSLVSAIR